MKRLVLLGALVLLVGGTALACIHPPRDYKGTVASTAQKAIIFWREGREELILKVNYALKGEGPAPANLGWVIPVPNKPDSYAVTSPKVFEEAFQLAESYQLPPRGPTNSLSTNLKVEKISVGEYNIAVLQARGPDAARELNDWLVKEDFSPYPVGNMKYYLDRDWTFLAVRINAPEAEKSVAKAGGLRPLRISFAADQIYYPLKFSSGSGEFKVLAHVFTEKALPKTEILAYRLNVLTEAEGGEGLGSSLLASADLRFNKRHWEKAAAAEKQTAKERLEWIAKEDARAETELYRLAQEMQKGKLGRFKKMYLTSFEGHVNGEKNQLSKWKTDLQLSVAKQGPQ